MATKIRHIRVPDDVWEPAAERAWSERTTPSAVVVEALREYGAGVTVAATRRTAAPEPRTEPPAPDLDPIAALRAQMAGFGAPLVMASDLGSAPEPEKRPCRHPSAAVRDNVCRER